MKTVDQGGKKNKNKRKISLLHSLRLRQSSPRDLQDRKQQRSPDFVLKAEQCSVKEIQETTAESDSDLLLKGTPPPLFLIP